VGAGSEVWEKILETTEKNKPTRKKYFVNFGIRMST